MRTSLNALASCSLRGQPDTTSGAITDRETKSPNFSGLMVDRSDFATLAAIAHASMLRGEGRAFAAIGTAIGAMTCVANAHAWAATGTCAANGSGPDGRAKYACGWAVYVASV